MREMIGTERDYVRSLHYIIENYTKELMREDIPQALRGQRNVIFGNVERIYEFHQQYFLEELERYEIFFMVSLTKWEADIGNANSGGHISNDRSNLFYADVKRIR